jgi:hypothetical protein
LVHYESSEIDKSYIDSILVVNSNHDWRKLYFGPNNYNFPNGYSVVENMDVTKSLEQRVKLDQHRF